MVLQTSQKIGIIAGRGDLPKVLYKVLYEKHPQSFVVGIKGFCTPETWANAYVIHPLAKVGAIIKSLKTAGVTHVVLAGAIDRPSLSTLMPDVMGAKLIAQLRKTSGGDDAILRLIVDFLQTQGFCVLGVDDILGQQTIPQGVLTHISPNCYQMQDIEKAKHILTVQSDLDIGQGLVIQEKIVLAVEAIEGTDAMIQRCHGLQRQGEYGPILVKSVKTHQTRTADLPTVGTETMERMGTCGFSGLAISGQGMIALHLEKMIEIANQQGMFIISI